MKFKIFASALIINVAMFFAAFSTQAETPQEKELREKNTYLVALDGYTFAFPYVYMELLRYKFTNIYVNDSTPYAPLNQFFHLRKLLCASLTLSLTSTLT